MPAQLYGPVRIDLNDGPVGTDYGRGFDGKSTARLVIGEGTESVAVSVTRSTPEALDQLAEAVAELKAWTLRQQQLRLLPEVI
ncbi:hypothetical protein M2164_005866 [Streptomyces sp. SAI-208]|uniref:hypothetical protein n=1 Tax=Streptomyces sp. SAI-208 TaxID=2940550 RepID=UPI002474FBC3|nr:hypothetical protein [Streptomyces sp. SAI-208]MDH6610231.1 hypothetical protein [Streptomyces sp. SAI-208]